ncbi:PREDICTED: protein bicaudal C homolog 1-B-like [Camelina sativa]|uniref:Protein bicaudal C homolog 1-B-like n=1 Tax=Camelina sativa TaxID=90675 RepID=A0ABM0X851_CAMSA|nr:PREDICTED: protein bicaudal C homolog 1-B-like [Camelina sativa]
MYCDRVEADTGISKTLKNRLNGGSAHISSRVTQVTRKRGRADDDKWEHDLFEGYDEPQLSNRRIDPKDLRLKLRKKHHGLQSGGRAFSLSVGDLRNKLSGTVNPQSRRQAARPVISKVSGATKSETRTAPNGATKKKSQQNDASVDSFLESLGLEKYSTSFQVEEVDMDALMHMTDDDLKALLIPMGPRKKILLALGSKRG